MRLVRKRLFAPRWELRTPHSKPKTFDPQGDDMSSDTSSPKNSRPSEMDRERETSGLALGKRLRLPTGFAEVFGRYWTIIALVVLIIMFSAMEGSSFASTSNLLSILNEV